MSVRQDVLGLGNFRIPAKTSVTPWPLTEAERTALARKHLGSAPPASHVAALTSSTHLWQPPKKSPQAWRG